MDDKITSMMREKRTFFPPKQLSRRAYIKSSEEYGRMYGESIKNPEKFWSAQGMENLDWFEMGDKVLEYDFSSIGKVKNLMSDSFLTGNLMYRTTVSTDILKHGKGIKLLLSGRVKKNLKNKL